MLQPVFGVHWNPEDVDFNTNEGMNLPLRVKASRRRTMTFLFHVLYIGYYLRYGPDLRWLFSP